MLCAIDIAVRVELMDGWPAMYSTLTLLEYSVNSRSEENFIRNTSLFGPRLEYVFRNTCGIRPEYCEYGQNTAPWEVFWNTWNTCTYSHSRTLTGGKCYT